MEKDIKLQALSATARAYFDRGVYVQYDQLFLNRSGSVREERRQKGMPPKASPPPKPPVPSTSL